MVNFNAAAVEAIPLSTREPSVTVTDETDEFSVVKYADWSMFNAPIQASGLNATASAGALVNLKIATFTDPDPDVDPFGFSASVTADTGSATITDPTVVPEGNGNYEVVADVNDSIAETVLISVDIEPPGGATATVESNVEFVPAPTVEKVMGPNVDVISWLQNAGAKGEAVMNWVSNPQPPLFFAPQVVKGIKGGEFGEFLGTRQFRNYLNAKMEVTVSDNKIIGFEKWVSQTVGYTSIPIAKTQQWPQGNGENDFKVLTETDNKVMFQVKAKFRVALVENVGQSTLNWLRLLPWAWVAVDYSMTLQKNGQVSFETSLAGSTIPSRLPLR